MQNRSFISSKIASNRDILLWRMIFLAKFGGHSRIFLAFVFLVCSWTVTAAPKATSKRCATSEAFDEKTRKCYPVGRQGPCGEMMVFQRTHIAVRAGGTEDFWAAYEDDYNDDDVTDSRSLTDVLIFSGSDPRDMSNRSQQQRNKAQIENSRQSFRLGRCECAYVFGPKCSSRPLLYWREHRRCYPVYSEGPCGKGKWIARRSGGLAVCEPNPCKDRIIFNKYGKNTNAESNLTEFIFPHNGRCYQTFTEAFCPQGQVALFPDPRNANARCFPNDDGVCPTDRIIGSSGPIACRNGTTLSHDGECREVADF